MKLASMRVLALASLASLAMATSSSAVTILQFGQTNVQGDFKVATVSGSTTTIVGRSVTGANAIPVQFTNIAGITVPGATPQFGTEVFNVTSSGPATVTNNRISQQFNGSISFFQGTGVTGPLVLRAEFTGATLSGDVGGTAASLDVSDPPRQVTFTSDNVAIRNLILANPFEAFSISFSNLLPGLTLSGTTIAPFTANQSGTFSVNPIPEPSGVVMAGTAMVASLGCFGWRRRQSSRA